MTVPTRTFLLSSLALVFTAVGQGWMVRRGWPGALPGLTAVVSWLAFTLLTQPVWNGLPTWGNSGYATDPNSGAAGRDWRNRGRKLLRRGAAPAATLLHLAGAAWLARTAAQTWTATTATVPPFGAFEPRVHLVGLTLLFALFFLRQFIGATAPGATARQSPAPALHLVIGLLALQSLAGLLAPLAPGVAWSALFARIVAGIAFLVAAEAVAAVVLRAFQPPRRRGLAPFSSLSLLLLVVLGSRTPLTALASALQASLGLEIRGTWLARALRAWLEPLALLFLLTFWLSSAVVVVPLGSEAVRVRWGRFQPETLGAGLHFIAPWPVERIRLVPVSRVDAFALGYEADLGGPLLWAEPHFSGERNLLVGDGEQVLTFNVPVQFSRPDALAAERAGPSLPAMLSHLAYRELLLATAPRDAFDIMTAEREHIARTLSAGLQAAADRLTLGVRVHHVGLKDIHPPVDVAPAYQEVISAREQRRMMVDLAHANRITSVALARVESGRARGTADGAAADRLAAVAGEAAVLTGKADARREEPELYDLQSRLILAEETVPRLRLSLVRGDPDRPAPLTLDYREGAAPLP